MLIRVKDIRGQSLSVVIDAPKDVRVVRTEILHTPEGQP
jgi:sRNA-binding carbon storage regulator CsrA